MAEAVAASAPAGKSDRELLLLVLERLGQQQAAIDRLSAAVHGQAQAAGPSESFIKRRSAVCGMPACQRRSLALESCVRGPPTLIEHMGTRPAATSMLPPDASAPCASDKMSDAELSSLAKRLHDENVLQDTPRPSSPRDKLEKLAPAGEAGDSRSMRCSASVRPATKPCRPRPRPSSYPDPGLIPPFRRPRTRPDRMPPARSQVRASTYCDLMALHVDDFREVVAGYPCPRADQRARARARRARRRRAGRPRGSARNGRRRR